MKLVVYNLLGEEVAVLVNEKQKPGIYELNWDPSADGVNNPSGIYLYKLSVGNFSKSRKMILLK